MGTSVDQQVCIDACYFNSNVRVTVIVGCAAMMVVIEHLNIEAFSALHAETNCVQHSVVAMLVVAIRRGVALRVVVPTSRGSAHLLEVVGNAAFTTLVSASKAPITWMACVAAKVAVWPVVTLS